jgi:protoheme IX farnesyltransferase
MLKKYYQLTKPGIIYGNAMTAIAGFLFAARGDINILMLLGMLVGLSLIIAASCIFNNIFDRDIDIEMERTKNRALVKGDIPLRNAIYFASALYIVGILVLAFFTNFLTLEIALLGAIVYVLLYTPLKRHSLYATLVGSISGATPIIAGYCAVTNTFDMGALILFLILAIWQMPHFYAIAIRRLDEYSAASIPVLPAKKGTRITKIHIVAYVAAFLIASLALIYNGHAGYTYAATMLLLGIIWLGFGLKGLRAETEEKEWARTMFFISLIVLAIFSIALALNYWLP